MPNKITIEREKEEIVAVCMLVLNHLLKMPIIITPSKIPKTKIVRTLGALRRVSVERYKMPTIAPAKKSLGLSVLIETSKLEKNPLYVPNMTNVIIARRKTSDNPVHFREVIRS